MTNHDSHDDPKAKPLVSEKSAPESAVLVRKSRKPRKKARSKRSKRAGGALGSADTGRPRAARSFPASTFEEALILADAIQRFAPGQEKVRKLTLFDKLGKSPDSGPSRQLMTNSSRYGLTKGGYHAEIIELTQHGSLATREDVAPAVKLQARFNSLLPMSGPLFLYERCKDKKMPSRY